MAKFRKKPVVIEAVQYRDGNWQEVLRFDARISAHCLGKKQHLQIATLEGDMRADDGDWIIRGVAGEVYPCKPDIFAATYEPVEG